MNRAKTRIGQDLRGSEVAQRLLISTLHLTSHIHKEQSAELQLLRVSHATRRTAHGPPALDSTKTVERGAVVQTSTVADFSRT